MQSGMGMVTADGRRQWDSGSMNHWADRAASLLLVVAAASAALSACDADIRRRSGEGSDEGFTGNEGGAPPGPVDVDDGEDPAQFAMCPEPPPRPDGLREGVVPSSAPDPEEAAAIFQRASHEMGHVVSVLLADPGDPPSDLLATDGETLTSDRDGEALRGAITRDAATGRICAAIVFGSWTGGHGGWGQSALDGTMLVLVEGQKSSAIGDLGLVESGPLEGAGRGDVRIEHDGELLSGSVDEVDF